MQQRLPYTPVGLEESPTSSTPALRHTGFRGEARSLGRNKIQDPRDMVGSDFPRRKNHSRDGVRTKA